MNPVAKIFQNGRSQAVRLPAAFRFDVSEVYVRRDPATGDVILSRVDYAESDSDLGEEDEDDPGPSRRFVRFDGEDAVDVPSGEEDDEEDDEAVPQWKRNLSEKAHAAFEESTRSRRRKDWTQLIYNSTASPESILGLDGSGDTSSSGAPRIDDDDFFTVKSSAPAKTEEDLDRTKEIGRAHV